ncbi:hypothetical protein DPMN_059134 [Dreissena polymorpha]|uniref:Uncharacterized protein n=1 Tax=Dreissena polymorpha TaxID=45954 RepID=A0A9D4C311_DREPO|nr:hypothetical protein DPMN_059134 [Dreissena polymorpha]
MAHVNDVIVNNEEESDREEDLTAVLVRIPLAIELKPNAEDTDKTRTNAAGKPDGLNDVKASSGNLTGRHLIYRINDTPPLHVTFICGLQQALLSLSGNLIVSLLVAEAVCASHDDVFKAKLLGSTLFMSGVTTVCQNLFGIRLPLFQGAAPEYVVPLLLVASADGNFCSSSSETSETNMTSNLAGSNGSLSNINRHSGRRNRHGQDT